MSVVDSHENLIFSDYSLNSNVDSAVELNKTPGASPTKLAEFVSKMADSQPSSNAEGFHKFQSKKTKETIGNLMFESTQIDGSQLARQNDIFQLQELEFMKNQHERETQLLALRQAQEIELLKSKQTRLLQDRKARRKTKQFQRGLTKEDKTKDLKLRDQEESNEAVQCIQEMVRQTDLRLQAYLKHTESRHEKQNKQLGSLQDRRAMDRRILVDLECCHLNDAEKSGIMKEFNVKKSHQKTIDKKVYDHQDEIQQQEVRHLKESNDAELQMIEELLSLKIIHHESVRSKARSQKIEYQLEKARILETKDAIKVMKIQMSNNSDVKRLISEHAAQARQLLKKQQMRIQKRRREWEAEDSLPTQLQSKEAKSDAFLTFQSRDSFNPRELQFSTESVNQEQSTSKESHDAEMDFQAQISFTETQQAQMKARLDAMVDDLSKLSKLHETSLEQLTRRNSIEYKSKENEILSKIAEREFYQSVERSDLLRQHENELNELISVQANELKLDEDIRCSETRALQERKVLASLLDNIADGIICIDSTGIIQRFNASCERMFGYSYEEVVGRNITNLMPPKYGDNHNQYLFKYLSTGEKKVVGKSRDVEGQKKDGTLFPINLSVSEVIDEAFHIFTGVVRDMTKSYSTEAARLDKEKKKQDELKQLMETIDVAKSKSDELLKQMLPVDISNRIKQGETIEPENFDECTILFSNVVDYAELIQGLHSSTIVDLLNNLYNCMDKIIDNHDVYKVETVGSQYVVVSGIPKRNGKQHTFEIADLALNLMSVIYTDFKMRHDNDKKLELKIGIHTGAAVASVVGTKMPRYCLFGDTMNTASRMESAGVSMRIQISEETFKILNASKKYILKKRGMVQVKGKGELLTYFLFGKHGFDKPLPSF